jgi:hypothetical protein
MMSIEVCRLIVWVKGKNRHILSEDFNSIFFSVSIPTLQRSFAAMTDVHAFCQQSKLQLAKDRGFISKVADVTHEI